jgi:hypothetical protein
MGDFGLDVANAGIRSANFRARSMASISVISTI